MLKYTIVYSYSVGSNPSMRSTMVMRDQVSVADKHELVELLKDDKYNGSTWFIFEGWPVMDGEENSTSKQLEDISYLLNKNKSLIAISTNPTQVIDRLIMPLKDDGLIIITKNLTQ